MNKKIPLAISIIILIAIALVVGWLLWSVSNTTSDEQTTNQPTNSNITSAANPLETVIITTPTPNALVSSPLVVNGFVQGTWMFEGTLPVELLDADGKLVAPSFGAANGDWMTENLVPFSATIQFTVPDTELGWLVVRANNPSGLPENDDQFRIPIRFQ